MEIPMVVPKGMVPERWDRMGDVGVWLRWASVTAHL